jgi:hypothetical protein
MEAMHDAGESHRNSSNPVSTPRNVDAGASFYPGTQPSVQSALDGKNVPHWYRMINRLMWIWRGIDPREILDVQARIVMSEPSVPTANSTIRWWLPWRKLDLRMV